MKKLIPAVILVVGSTLALAVHFDSERSTAAVLDSPEYDLKIAQGDRLMDQAAVCQTSVARKSLQLRMKALVEYDNQIASFLRDHGTDEGETLSPDARKSFERVCRAMRRLFDANSDYENLISGAFVGEKNTKFRRESDVKNAGEGFGKDDNQINFCRSLEDASPIEQARLTDLMKTRIRPNNLKLGNKMLKLFNELVL